MSRELSPAIQEQIEKGISILREGGLVAYPTDTVYGLGASAFLPQAVWRVYQVKARPLSMPLPLLLADKSQIADFVGRVSPSARLLIDNFLPGALTIVLPRASTAPATAVAGGKTVAVRIPAHPVPLALIEGVGTPIVGTSANLSGKPSATTAGEVRAQLGGKIDFVIDGGRCPGGRESTVVDLTGAVPVIRRRGVVSKSELEGVCGDIFKEA